MLHHISKEIELFTDKKKPRLKGLSEGKVD